MSELFEVSAMPLDELMESDSEEGFSIKDDAVAEWAIKKISEEKKEKDRLDAACDEQIAYYEAIKEGNAQRFERRTAFLKSKLEGYWIYGNLDTKETKTQMSYKLPSGSLVWTKPKQVMEKNDEELVSYLEKSGSEEFLKVTIKPDWAEFKKKLEVVDGKVIDTGTGEEVAGVTAIERPGTFDIKL